jgi:hypothetical protein
MAKETRSNKEFSTRTHEVGRWAREHIKRQTGASSVKSHEVEQNNEQNDEIETHLVHNPPHFPTVGVPFQGSSESWTSMFRRATTWNI